MEVSCQWNMEGGIYPQECFETATYEVCCPCGVSVPICTKHSLEELDYLMKLPTHVRCFGCEKVNTGFKVRTLNAVHSS